MRRLHCAPASIRRSATGSRKLIPWCSARRTSCSGRSRPQRFSTRFAGSIIRPRRHQLQASKTRRPDARLPQARQGGGRFNAKRTPDRAARSGRLPPARPSLLYTNALAKPADARRSPWRMPPSTDAVFCRRAQWLHSPIAQRARHSPSGPSLRRGRARLCAASPTTLARAPRSRADVAPRPTKLRGRRGRPCRAIHDMAQASRSAGGI